MLEDFIKDYDRSIYERHPKSKITIRVIYAVLILAIVVGVVRAVILLK